jgi:hypothetical protein
MPSVAGCAAHSADASASTEAAETSTVAAKVKDLRDLLNKDTQAPLAHTKTVTTRSDVPQEMLVEYLEKVHTRTATDTFSFAADPSEVKIGRSYGTLSTVSRAVDVINGAQGFDGKPWKRADEAQGILADIVDLGAQLGYDADGRSDNGSTQVLLLVIDTSAKKVFSVETFQLVD